MIPISLSPCIVTPLVEASRAFYTQHFDAKVAFDCGWYLSLEFQGGASLQFMAPQADQAVCHPAGLTYNWRVEDVDAEHQRLAALGLAIVTPLADHPWGDRGFTVQDPNGIVLYIYSDREPSADFKPYFMA